VSAWLASRGRESPASVRAEVEPRRRLIQKQQRRLGGQAARDLEQPLLAEGQAAGQVLRECAARFSRSFC
jgi:hypothetical protein